jgi:hypothetical protein
MMMRQCATIPCIHTIVHLMTGINVQLLTRAGAVMVNDQGVDDRQGVMLLLCANNISGNSITRGAGAVAYFTHNTSVVAISCVTDPPGECSLDRNIAACGEWSSDGNTSGEWVTRCGVEGSHTSLNHKYMFTMTASGVACACARFSRTASAFYAIMHALGMHRACATTAFHRLCTDTR